MGADLATPENSKYADKILRISSKQVQRIEKEIDEFNSELDELQSFVLPGGSMLASWFHFARTNARRSERRITKLAAEEVINSNILLYINRLSDLLFVMARFSNNNGQNDVLWQPGKSR